MSGISSPSGLAAKPESLRFGRSVPAADEDSVQWLLKRNCSMAPRQLFRFYLGASVVSLGIGGMFWLHGATLVLPFAGLEMLALGAALMMYARHAGDRECIRLQGGVLSVEHACGRRIERVDFRPGRVRVEPVRGDGSLVGLSGQGRRIEVGRFVRPELRRQLADELRAALHRDDATRGDAPTGWIGSGN